MRILFKRYEITFHWNVSLASKYFFLLLQLLTALSAYLLDGQTTTVREEPGGEGLNTARKDSFC